LIGWCWSSTQLTLSSSYKSSSCSSHECLNNMIMWNNHSLTHVTHEHKIIFTCVLVICFTGDPSSIWIYRSMTVHLALNLGQAPTYGEVKLVTPTLLLLIIIDIELHMNINKCWSNVWFVQRQINPLNQTYTGVN